MKKILPIVAAVFITSMAFAKTPIGAEEAGKYLGKKVTVCSKVYGVSVSGKAVHLAVGAAFPKNPLTLTIQTKDITGYKTSHDLYKDKFICVTGRIRGNRNNPELVILSENDIQIKGSAMGGDIDIPDPGNRYFLPIF